MPDLEELADKLELTEERKSALDLEKRRCTINHTLLLHRDKVSVTDIEEMIAHLRKSGMPDTATLSVDSNNHHTRLWAQWSTDPNAQG